MKADLHVHSCYSDGSLPFRDILQEAARQGITHIAFTDHDSTTHTEEALRLGAEYKIAVIPAVEISAFDSATGRKVHILGYDYERKKNSAIEELCAPILKRRHENGQRQIEILVKLGYDISEDRVLAYAAGATIYKQHILKYLQHSGQLDQSSGLFGDVYRTIFKNGGPCDFDIEYVEALDAVRAIREDGGLAVLAHPGQQQNLDLIPALVAAGLAGVERNHPANTRQDREIVSELVGRYGLFCTGGSDFHGEYEAKAHPLGSCLAPEDCPLLVR